MASFTTSGNYNRYNSNMTAMADTLKNRAIENAQNADSARNRYNSLLGQYGNKTTYTKSDEQKNAQNKLEQLENNAPKEYTSNYSDAIAKLYDTYSSHTSNNFNYNINYDPLYKQYAEQYSRNAKNAMNNSVANAQASTGGYGSTYAQTAGSLAYNGEMAKLNDKVPELYQQAYSRYKDDGTNIYNRINLLMKLDTADYGKYRDNVEDYFTFLNYYSDKYQNAKSFDYKLFAEEWKQYESMLDTAQQDYMYNDKATATGFTNAMEGYSSSANNQLKADLADFNARQELEKINLNAENDRQLAVLRAQLSNKTAESSGTATQGSTEEDTQTNTEDAKGELIYGLTKQQAIGMAQEEIYNEKYKTGEISKEKVIEIAIAYKNAYGLNRGDTVAICTKYGVSAKEVRKALDELDVTFDTEQEEE